MMVVVVIVILLVALSFPAMNALRVGSGTSAAQQTINAALMAARSYAIMNRTLTAVRFQPNGKIFVVYKVPTIHLPTPTAATEGILRVEYGNDFATASNVRPYPSTGATPALCQPNATGSLYLPVAGREALQLPANVIAVDTSRDWDDDTSNGVQPIFPEPFYVCYRPDGSLAVGERVWVGLTDEDGEPVNIRYAQLVSGVIAMTDPAWDDGEFDGLGGYDYDDWKDFIKDPANIGDIDVNSIYRFSNVVLSSSMSAAIGDANNRAKMNDADHYAGFANTGDADPCQGTLAVNQVTLLAAPEGWDALPIVDVASAESKTAKVIELCRDLQAAGEPNQTDRYEQLYINAYTGRLIPQK
jgi:type II secretory pathway pseudopilin PulG